MRVAWSTVVELDVPGAVERTSAIARAVEETGVPWVATTLVTGEALVMGGLQREEQVRLRHAHLENYPVEKRATTGVSLLAPKGAIQQLIVVPRVNALYSDANAGNFINRTVRGFLRAYNRSGAKAHYFGREHFTLSRRPAGILGLDVTSGGAWILEAWVGVEAAAPVVGFRGNAPIGLREALREAGSKRAEASPLELAERLHEKLRGAFDVPPADQASGEPQTFGLRRPVSDSIPGALQFAQLEVPIGVLELACRVREPSGSYEVWFRGDMLTSLSACEEFERRLQAGSGAEAMEAFSSVPFEGAQRGDLGTLIQRLPQIS